MQQMCGKEGTRRLSVKKVMVMMVYLNACVLGAGSRPALVMERQIAKIDVRVG